MTFVSRAVRMKTNNPWEFQVKESIFYLWSSCCRMCTRTQGSWPMTYKPQPFGFSEFGLLVLQFFQLCWQKLLATKMMVPENEILHFDRVSMMTNHQLWSLPQIVQTYPYLQQQRTTSLKIGFLLPCMGTPKSKFHSGVEGYGCWGF